MNNRDGQINRGFKLKQFLKFWTLIDKLFKKEKWDLI